MSSLPNGQHMARVSVPEKQWLEFCALAVRKKQSVAAYLGYLVEKELRRAARAEQFRAARQAQSQAVATADGDEVDENWVPPWEV